MSTKLKALLFLVVVLLITSCSERIVNKQLQGKWNFGTIESELTKGAALGTEHYSDNYIFLQEEAKATSFLFGHYLNGNWSFNAEDSILSLQTMKEETLRFKVVATNENELWLSLISTNKVANDLSDDAELVFFKEEQNLSNSVYNYTKPAYNQFRNAPKKSETPEQINQRVKEAVQYALVFFKYGREQEKSSIKLNSINLPIHFYDNGVSMTDQSEKWNSIFYSPEEARIGYQMIRAVFDQDLNLPEHKRGMELNEYILNEMYKRL